MSQPLRPLLKKSRRFLLLCFAIKFLTYPQLIAITNIENTDVKAPMAISAIKHKLSIRSSTDVFFIKIYIPIGVTTNSPTLKTVKIVSKFKYICVVLGEFPTM